MSERTLPRGYELVSSLGAGGFGEVLLARQTALGRLVAVKRLHGRALSAPDDLERFRREGQVLASLNHPCVVRVWDFRRAGPDAILVMEYVEGTSLAGLLEDSELTVAAALVVLRDVAEGLRAAAGRGIVHRDIKPDNVFVQPDGRAKLGDFGLARVVADPEVFRTTDGSVRCTPAYAPPELSQGSCEPDQRSDAYSFAVMAYEVLTGRLPFEAGSFVAQLAAHWADAPPDPATVSPGFPPAAAQALLAGLSKEPSQRPLPHELVAQLFAVPPSDWPRRSAPASARSVPTRVVATAGPPLPTLPDLPKPGPVQRRKRRVLLAVGVAAGLLVGGALLLRDDDPGAGQLRAGQVALRTDPPAGTGRCPSARFTFRATIATNGAAGELRLRWTRPDGVQTETVAVAVVAGQRAVAAELTFDVTGQRPLTGTALLQLLTPDPQAVTSSPVRYLC